nr:hypothetical protein [Tanacetum cinerariifolium]
MSSSTDPIILYDSDIEDNVLKVSRRIKAQRGSMSLERNKTDLEEQSLDYLFNNFKIYKAEVKSSSSASTTTQKITFVSSSNTDSTNELVSAAASVSTVSAKAPVSPLPNVDSMSNAAIYLFFASQSNSPQLDSDDLKIGRNLGTNGPTSMGFDMSKVDCYHCHRKGHFARECRKGHFARECRPSAPIIEDWVSDSEDETETKTPQNVPSFVQPTEQVKSPRPYVQHVETSIPPATSKTAIPKPTSNDKHKNRKACFVCKSLDHLIKDCHYHEKKMAQPTARNHTKRGNHKPYAQMPLLNPQRHVVPAAVLTQSKHVPITAVRPVTTDVPNISVNKPRQAKTVVTKTNSPPKRHINRSPSPKSSNFSPKVTAVKALMVNAA